MNFFKSKVLSETQISQTNKNFKNGMIYLKKKDYQKALIFFKRSLRELPNQPTIFNNVGVSLAGLNKYDESLHYYKKALEINPNYMIATYNLSVALFNMEEYEQALKLIKNAENLIDKEHPAISRLILAKGNILEKLDRVDETINIFQHFLIKGSSEGIKTKLASLYLDKKKYSQVIDLLLKNKEIDQIDSHTQLKLLIAAFQNMGETVYLKQTLQKYINLTNDLNYLKTSSQKMIDDRKFGFAIPYLEILFDKNPEDIEFGLVLAKLLVRLNLVDQAVKVAYKIFQILMKRNDIEKSEKIANMLWEWKPDFLDARLALVDFFKTQGEWHRAEGQYTIIFDQKKEDINLLKDYLKVLEELAKKDRKYLDKILKIWEDMALLKPNDPDILYELGINYAIHLKYQEAIQFLEQAIDLKPELHEAHYQLGLLYMSINRPQRALTFFLGLRNKKQDFPQIEEIIKEIRKRKKEF